MLSEFAVYLKGSADVGICSLCVLPTLQLKGLDRKQINKVQFFCAEKTGTIQKQVKVDSGKINLSYSLQCTEQLIEHQTNHKVDSIENLPAQ